MPSAARHAGGEAAALPAEGEQRELARVAARSVDTALMARIMLEAAIRWAP